jgi:hypothetical protein
MDVDAPRSSARLGPLRKAREAASAFDAHFFERDARFAPIVAVAEMFADCDDWPNIAAIDRALAPRAGVRFVPAVRRPRRQRGPIALGDLYDARIARGEVPTRERCWHDLLNAFVWATFPKSKRALHARQHTALQTWARANAILDGDRVAQLPNARTRELDALALVDEGGVLVRGDTHVVFGHALYEGFVLEVPAMIARGVPLAALTDDALAARLAEPLSPEILPRVALAEKVR